MSGPGEGFPHQAGPSAVPPRLGEDFRLRVGNEGSALRGQEATQRNAKRVATSPPQTTDLDMDPPPLSDAELQSMKDVLAGHDYNFASINAVSKESAIKKKGLEELLHTVKQLIS